MEQNRYFLLLYKNSGAKQRAQLLQISNRSQFLSILECCANCLVGNVTINAPLRKRLKTKRELFRLLSFDKKKCWKTKKALVHKNQVGGIIAELVSTAVGYLFDKLGNALFSRENRQSPSPPRDEGVGL